MKSIATILGFAVLASAAYAGPKTQAAQQKNPPAKAATAPAAPAAGKIDPAKEADIRRLLELSGTKELAQQTMGSMEQSIRPMLTASLPPGDYRDKLIDLFFAKFHSKMSAQQIVEMAVPAYDKYFSQDEIKGLVQFYGTPLGRKTLQVLPKLMGELQDQGRQWGERVGRESMEEVMTEHPELAQALEEAQKAKQP